ncbi:uncharacterized protein PAC_17947 [Phialocephala subalpina]|uniref:C2H2-type domain-containing protein n=1 Tax=Phialocephala subalpina TaxID=576137 RepID=A0A1L7XSU2_9HELO|nr:uncharacterized protein PAC_17947 [Phialocephala subalpina]
MDSSITRMPCPQSNCSKTFTRSGNRRRHCREIHGMTFQCHARGCDFMGASQLQLDGHICDANLEAATDPAPPNYRVDEELEHQIPMSSNRSISTVFVPYTTSTPANQSPPYQTVVSLPTTEQVDGFVSLQQPQDWNTSAVHTAFEQRYMAEEPPQGPFVANTLRYNTPAHAWQSPATASTFSMEPSDKAGNSIEAFEHELNAAASLGQHGASSK